MPQLKYVPLHSLCSKRRSRFFSVDLQLCHCSSAQSRAQKVVDARLLMQRIPYHVDINVWKSPRELRRFFFCSFRHL